MASWADKIVGGINDVGSVTDAFRDALDGNAREDVKKDEEKAAWKWQPIALALGGVVLVVVVLKFVMKR
jgi:hypothetical protein